jgi:hypothetical protein
MPDIGRRHVFIFSSGQNRHLFAFTRNTTGDNLPRRYGPWHPSEHSAMQGTIMGAAGEPSDVVLSAIETRGFYLSRSDGNAW